MSVVSVYASSKRYVDVIVISKLELLAGYFTTNSTVFAFVTKSASSIKTTLPLSSLYIMSSLVIVLPDIAFPSSSKSAKPLGSPLMVKLCT